MSQIIIYTAGTLGDHLPYIALGQALRARGHQVTMVINQAMHRYAGRAGLPAVALTDVERGPEEARLFAHAWNHWQQPGPDAPQAPPLTIEQLTLQASELIEICRGADLLLSTSIRTLGWVAHAALNIPWMSLSMNPAAFWQPHAPDEIQARQQARAREYTLLKEVIGQTLANLGINTPVPPHAEGWLLARHVLLASSQYFSLPNLNQLQPHASLDLTGFWHYHDPDWAGWQPDEALRRFCQRRPIVLAFSSQPLEEPQRILATHAEAAARLGLPLLVQRGWANFSEEMLPGHFNHDDIFFADFLPHDWLFAQAACAIQHGGIGSIAQALRQGCPLLIEPFGNDQLYNASRVDGLGVGAALHPLKMTVDGLVRNLAERVLTPGYRRRAEAIGQKLREEDGLTTACQLIERYLARLGPNGQHPAIYSHFTPPLTPRRQLPDAAALESWFEALPPADSSRPPLHTGSTRDTIPKIIHQTWKDEAAPPQLHRFQQSWQRHHPDWRYILWTDADNRALLARHYPWFLPIYDSYPEPIMRADAARYFILHRYGGVYADLDFECLRPLEPLLENRQLVFGLEPDEHLAVHFSAVRPFAQIICNAWLASIPEHPFWPHLFRQLVAYHPLAEPMHSTGPFLLTRAVEIYPGAAGISLEPAARLYPITAEQSRQRVLADPARQAHLLRDAFAVHHWHSTWWPESLALRRGRQLVTVLDAGRPGDIIPLPETGLLPEAAPPRISCLMVTRDRPDLARRAVHCYRQQSYPNRELVIVDDGDDDSLAGWVAGLGDDSIRVIRLPDQGQSLGELRNLAVARATGDYIAQWDDDDLSHWQRLEIQMGALLASGAAACFLEREQLWWPQQQRFALSNRRAWEGSMICARAALPAYPARRQGEDTPVVEQILSRQRVALLDYPQLYTYVYHGDNTFSAGHWDSLWAAATRRYHEPLAGALFVNLQNDIRLALPAPPDAAAAPLPPAIEPGETQPIPKIIHQTWSTAHPPAELAAYQRGWREHHPDWRYYLWTDDDLRRFIAQHYRWFLPIYDGYPQHIMRVDAARYFILYHFGGVYADLDFECVRPIEPLLAGRELAFGLEPPLHLELHLARDRRLEQIVGNAWLASTPGHPFWEHAFNKLVEYHRMPGPLDATGPFMLTRAVDSYPQRQRIAIISHEALYPVTNQKPWADYSPQEQAEVLAQAFALHHWRGSWWQNEGRLPAIEIIPQPEQPEATVLLLVPVKDAAPYLPRFFENVRQLSYPHRLISLAFLESDSRDDTYAQIEAELPALRGEFAAARLFKQDYGLQLTGPRWEQGIQYRRRSVLAKSRNQLLARALTDEQWALWLDVDVVRWPVDVIEQLLAARQHIVAPNCLSEQTGDTFDYNTFQLTPDASLLDWQPPPGFGRRYLNDLRRHSLVELDGVGGTMLLVHADLHREGLIFPTFAYKHHIETEGMALLARDMGYRCWGLPNLEIFHK